MTRQLLILALAAFVLYGLVEARSLILGPSLVIASPARDGAVFADGIVVIEGRVLRAVSLTQDGAPLLPDQSGRFSSTLAFPEGTSILTIVATDRFGRSVKKERLIYVPESHD